MKAILSVTLLVASAVYGVYNDNLYAGRDATYVLAMLPDGTVITERAWVVDKRVVITLTDETDAYLSDMNGVFTGDVSAVRFVARHAHYKIKVYMSDRDLKLSESVPPQLLQEYAELRHLIEEAGGLDRHRELRNIDEREAPAPKAAIGYL